MISTTDEPIIVTHFYCQTFAPSIEVIRLATSPFINATDHQPFDDFIIEPPAFRRYMQPYFGNTPSRTSMTFFAHESLSFLHDALVGDLGVTLYCYFTRKNKTLTIAEMPKLGVLTAESLIPAEDTFTLNLNSGSVLDKKIGDTHISTLIDEPFAVGDNVGNLKPVVFGRVFNIKPLVEDSTTYKYCASYATAEITNVRDSGLPVSFTDNNDGTFTLNQAPAGEVTCDVNANGLASVPLQEIVASILTLIDISTYSTNYETLPDVDVGIYVTDRPTARTLLNLICRSIRYFYYFNTSGELTFMPMPSRTDEATCTLTLDNIKFGGVRIEKTVLRTRQVKVNYAKNYTVQGQVAGGVSAADKERFGKAFLTHESDELEVYWTLDPIVEIETCLNNEVDAVALAQETMNEEYERRRLVEVDAVDVQDLDFDIGNIIEFSYPDFGIENVNAMIVDIKEKPLDEEATIKLWL